MYIYIYVSPCLTVKSPLVGPTKSSPWGPHVWYFSTLSWLEKSPLVISPLFIARCFLCFMFNSPVLLVKSPFPSGEEKNARRCGSHVRRISTRGHKICIMCTHKSHKRFCLQELDGVEVGFGWGGMLMFTGTCKQRTGGFGVGWDVNSHWHLQTKDAHIQGWGGVDISLLNSSRLFPSLSSSQLFSAQVSAFLNSRVSPLLVLLVLSKWRPCHVFHYPRIRSVSLSGSVCVCDPKSACTVYRWWPDSEFCWWNPQFCGFHLLVKSQFCWLDPQLNDQKKTPCLVNSIMSRTGSTQLIDSCRIEPKACRSVSRGVLPIAGWLISWKILLKIGFIMVYHGLSWFIMDDNWGTIYGNLHISPPGFSPHATVPAQPSPSDFPRQQLLEDSNSA